MMIINWFDLLKIVFIDEYLISRKAKFYEIYSTKLISWNSGNSLFPFFTIEIARICDETTILIVYYLRQNLTV